MNLPKSWIKNFQLNKNSTVVLDLRGDGCLVINPRLDEEGDLEEEVQLEASRSVPREIVKHSMLGKDKIVVKSDKPFDKELLKDIYLFINRLPNTDIFEETPHRIEIRTFKIENIPTNQIIKKLLIIVCDMFENVRNSDEKLESNFNNLIKFYYTLVRHLRKYLYSGMFVSSDSDLSPLEAMDMRIFCQKIQKIGEVLLNLRINPTVLKFFEITERYYNEVMDAYLKKDYNSAYELWFKRDELEESARKLTAKLESDAVDKIKDMIMIARYCRDMAALI